MNNAVPNYQDVLACEGMRFLNRMKVYKFSYHCFSLNMLELIQGLEQLAEIGFAIDIWNVEKREKQQFVFQEVIRRFHNAVAAAKSLVEHTRIFVDEHYGKTNDIATAYREKVSDVFAGNGNAAVIEDLRNYFLHAGIPPVKLQLSFDASGDAKQGVDIKHEVLLDLEALKSWGRWKSRSKAYLAELPGNIDLLALVSEYRATVETFHVWFSAFLHEHHAKDIEHLYALDSAVNAGMSNSDNT